MSRIPQEPTSFYLIINAIWFSFPFAFFFLALRVLAMAYPDDSGLQSLIGASIYSTIVAGIWIVLGIGLNFFLRRRINVYPARVSIFFWNNDEHVSSWLWTIACASFVAVYIFLIICFVETSVEEPPPRWGYYPIIFALVLFSVASLWVRAAIVAQTSSNGSGWETTST